MSGEFNAHVGRHRQSRAEKVQLTVYVPEQVAESARNAVVATGSYRLGYRSLSGLVADAITEKVGQLSKQFNNGNEFPLRSKELRPGRPIG